MAIFGAIVLSYYHRRAAIIIGRYTYIKLFRAMRYYISGRRRDQS